jgi:rod shape-determining protein MreD
MSRSIYVGIPLLVLLLVLQTSALPYLQVGGITPQLALLAAISWGLQRGAAEGMVWAFFAGMMLDVFSFAPQGTTAISLMVAILAVTRLQQVVPENPVLLPVLLTGLTFAVYLALSLVVLWLTGHSFSWSNVSQVLPAVVLHGLLGLPASWLARTLDRMLFPRPIEA